MRPLARKNSFDSREPGFTLTDLLVAVVVIALLGATIATALASTKPNTLAFQCLNNLRQLGSAWTMYSDDYQGWLVYNHDGALAGKDSSEESWVGGWLDYSTSSDNTNTDLLINHVKYPRAAFFGSYLKTASVFKCPADKSTFASTAIPRVRSVSLNNFMGKNTRSWTTPTSYTIYTKISQLASPARLFLFLDEREDSINDPLFFSDPDHRFQMFDFPGSYHDGADIFVFADDHGETHKWLDPRTTPPINPGQLIPLNISIPGDIDVDWLQQHASELPH
jgi:type II secretory pathway pseudopilin PulG